MSKGKSKNKKSNSVKNQFKNNHLDSAIPTSTFTENLKKSSISELNAILKIYFMRDRLALCIASYQTSHKSMPSKSFFNCLAQEVLQRQ